MSSRGDASPIAERNSGSPRDRVAIVTTHPIQYHAPWFRWMTEQNRFDLRVFYLWNPAASTLQDPGFDQPVKWDLPLLEGYDYEFVSNTSVMPGTGNFRGLRNPELLERLRSYQPTAALLIGYKYRSLMRLIFTSERKRGFPLLFRGDSHRLGKVESRKEKVESRSEGGQGSAVRSLRSELRRRLISGIYRRFAAFLYVGQANREYFRLHGVPEHKLFFSPHAIENDRFLRDRDIHREEGRKWRRELGIPETSLLTLFAGKFQEKKRPLDLLEGFLRLRRDDHCLLFVGAGALEAPLRERSASAQNIYFAPFQNQTAMPRTYAAADLFVLPSFGAEESWGLAVNEALCLGLPVIVSTHVGCGPDLIHDGQNGLVFPAGDVDALAGCLQEALNNPERLRRWGEEGRKMVRNYNFERAADGLEKALQKVEKKK